MCSIVRSNALFLLLLVLASVSKEELYEGSHCTMEQGNPGVCRQLSDCPFRMQEVIEGRRHTTSSGRCGFVKDIEIVCCPINITRKISPRPADIACQEYNEQSSQLYDLSFHIYGGVEAKPGEFPYAVALGYVNKDLSENPAPITYECGGSLISIEHVLTAAHCVNNINEKVPVEVRVGNESIVNIAANVQRIPISDIISHPKYKRSVNYNDVAILKLKTKVLLSSAVYPVCLQTQFLNTLSMTPKMSLIVIGWGATDFSSLESNSINLRRTPALRLVDREECTKDYVGFPKLPNGIDDSMICAVDTNLTRGADACLGDSGGPLLLFSQQGVKVVGITAFGQACGGSKPGVYTAIYPYLDWIEEQVWIRSNENNKAVVKAPSNKSEPVINLSFINPIFNITYTSQ
ncbi:serine protease snake-like isoform X1 [Bombus vosnesenskii]|uniref:Serine protease snake-like isoform X1 n=2 Tax=Bombus vosnesenskii TaxID=207650 RepID=A0A6J3KMU0_9HYME|nr:serine protease snake-like isoform X1 [Bombus vancouverensis nearcticus]XP_033353521.1 serine protease snake-like isoform X1 [Bombus vosnesenskii]XP_050482619.1 serine protease snake-like isoform X1 [Bombus huntii]